MYLQLSAAARSSGPTTLDIYAELSPNAASLELRDGDLSRRPLTAAHVKWSLEPWTTVGQSSRSPNLASVLKEILNQSGWQSGNAVLLVIHVSGAERLARVIDKRGHGAPVLYVQLEADQPSGFGR